MLVLQLFLLPRPPLIAKYLPLKFHMSPYPPPIILAIFICLLLLCSIIFSPFYFLFSIPLLIEIYSNLSTILVFIFKQKDFISFADFAFFLCTYHSLYQLCKVPRINPISIPNQNIELIRIGFILANTFTNFSIIRLSFLNNQIFDFATEIFSYHL